jgi:hypothetical protein
MNFFAEVYEQVEAEQDTSPVDGDIYPERQQAAITPAPAPSLNPRTTTEMGYDLSGSCEIRKYGSRTWGVYIVSQTGQAKLLAVVLYKKAGYAIQHVWSAMKNEIYRCHRQQELNRVA